MTFQVEYDTSNYDVYVQSGLDSPLVIRNFKVAGPVNIRDVQSMAPSLVDQMLRRLYMY